MESRDNTFVGLVLRNSEWDRVCNQLSEYLEYINIPKLVKDHSDKLWSDPSHITLCYTEEVIKGPNWLNWLTRVKLRDLFNQLRSNPVIEFMNPVIDTFDNPDARVLKLNVVDSGCKQLELLQNYHDSIMESLGVADQFQYNPHITLTYVNADTSDGVIEGIKSKFSMSELKTWDVTQFMINDSRSTIQ